MNFYERKTSNIVSTLKKKSEPHFNFDIKYTH